MFGWVRRRRKARVQRRRAQEEKRNAATAFPKEVASHFQRLADEFGLSFQLDPVAPVEVSLTFPRQPGLQRDIWVCLQNDDELWFTVDRFTYCAFPYPEVWPTYETLLKGIIRGTCMVQHHGRTSYLMSLEGTEWKRVAVDWTLSRRSGSFRNDPKARADGMAV
ncbi:MAG: hypothetical protein INF48_14375 [Rhodobacter sp.]|nr:hypothetical protein [Rhodobacter sp.]